MILNQQAFEKITDDLILYNPSIRIKQLATRIKSKGGRSYGLIVCPRRVNYLPKFYRFCDFLRIVLPEQKGLVLKSEIYDPIRSANLSLICYPTGLFVYILKPTKLQEGALIVNMKRTNFQHGDSSLLLNMPSGALIHNIAGKYCRSAGCSTILVRKDTDQALLKLKSGELRFFNLTNMASFGLVGNEGHFLENFRTAGRSGRFFCRRPRPRPCASNPVDHPMGGRTRGGIQVDRNGKLIFNKSTVKHKKRDYILYSKRNLKLMKN